MKTPVTFGDPCEPNQSYLISLNGKVVRFRCPPAFLLIHFTCTLQPLALRTCNITYISCLWLDSPFCFISSACGWYTFQLNDLKWNDDLNNGSSSIYQIMKSGILDSVSGYYFVGQFVYNLWPRMMMKQSAKRNLQQVQESVDTVKHPDFNVRSLLKIFSSEM